MTKQLFTPGTLLLIVIYIISTMLILADKQIGENLLYIAITFTCIYGIAKGTDGQQDSDCQRGSVS